MERKAPKRLTPYGSFAAVSLLEYGGFKSILPCLGGRSDAACRVVVRRMREERFNHALPVLVVVRFCGVACAVFFAPGGSVRAAGLLGVGLCARLPRRPCAGFCAGRA